MKKTQVKKEKRIKAELPGGFRDYNPSEAILRQRLLEKIRKTFEEFGFDPMETPGVERTEVLTGGEKESQKIIFNVKGSREKTSDSSLRFDLTVPLARFLAANPEIPKPFKRYQIGNVWRGESPQAGRFREFMQADIDIVGSSSPDADSEIVAVIYTFLKKLGLNKFVIKINNRKLLNELPQYAGFPEKKLWNALRIIDKQDKQGEVKVSQELKKEFGPKVTTKIQEFLKNPPAQEGWKELEEIERNIQALGVEKQNYSIDPTIVRGLGYYTGPVFETVLLEAPEFGSIWSGGRYDGLMVPFTGQKIPAVGASIGVDRLFAALDKLGLLKKKQTTTKVLILDLSPTLKKEYQEFATTLREANINTSLYLGDDKAFQAQLSYAIKKEIPNVLIYGDIEQKKNIVTIKNLVTREQKEVPKEKLKESFK